MVRGVVGNEARLVLFLKGEGFNSNQIKYICTKLLKIEGKNIYNKIRIYVKNVEINDAIRRFNNNNVLQKLKLQGLI